MSTVIPTHLPDQDLRDWLIQEIANIDQERREIKARIGRLARGNIKKQAKDSPLRELGEKLITKFQEREDLRILLGDVNARIKSTNKLINNKPKRDLRLATAFMNAAEEILAPDLFAEIELQALKALETNQPTSH